MTADQLEALRHLRGVSDHSAAEILRTLAPAQRPRPLKVQVPVLDVRLANPAHGFGDVECKRSVPFAGRCISSRTRRAWQMSACRSLPTAADTDSHGRALATLDGTRESHRRRAIVAVQMIRDILRLLRVGLGQRNQAAVMTRRARTRRELPRSEAP